MIRKEEIKEQAQGRILLSCNFDQNLIGMAEWADETMIEKACKWLKDNVDHYAYNKDFVTKEQFIKSFRKAMEK